jgi:hypothetical protein
MLPEASGIMDIEGELAGAVAWPPQAASSNGIATASAPKERVRVILPTSVRLSHFPMRR